jgi:hypothetical protein
MVGISINDFLNNIGIETKFIRQSMTEIAAGERTEYLKNELIFSRLLSSDSLSSG